MMIMAQGSKHMSMIMPKELETHHSCVIMERPRSEDGDVVDDSSVSSVSGSDESTTNSDASSSSSSLDLMEDASSNGPLYELSELMSNLPIKRGLSKFYQGKSESFTSLASVKNFEDLAKKERPSKRKSKSKSCGDINKCSSYSPKATIAKKVQRGSFLSSSVMSRKAVLYKRAFDL